MAPVKAYGTPIALVHDMGRAILKAVTTVFPKVPDYICHFHFLRDIGKDLFDFEYRTIRRYTRSFNIRVTLNKVEKVLQPLFGLIVLTLIFLPKNKELKN